MEPGDSSGARTFRDVFKFYKRKNTILDGVCYFGRCGHEPQGMFPFQDNIERITIDGTQNELDWETTFGLRQPKDWEVYNFTLKPGLIYIKNPFTPNGQRYWIARSLKGFTKKPHCLNIDAHGLLNEEDDWWEFCQRMSSTEKGKQVLRKLRWATMGYHHNWDTKEYSEESKSLFPEDLKLLCEKIGSVLGFQSFNAEAAIVNFYHHDSCLNGHTDHSELNLSAPLFSFSFGQSAIFLIGGKTIEEEAMPLLLESGDIVVMSSEARLYYHGVPKILKESNNKWNPSGNVKLGRVLKGSKLEAELAKMISDDQFWKPFGLYVDSSRINVNVRQVLPLDQVKL